MLHINSLLLLCVFCGYFYGGAFQTINDEYVGDDYEYDDYDDDISKTNSNEKEYQAPSNLKNSSSSSSETNLTPYFEQPELKISALLNDDILINCDVRNFHAKKSIMWLNGSTIIANGQYALTKRVELMKNNSIRIRSVQNADAGDYYCEVLPDKVRLHVSLTVANIAIYCDGNDVSDRTITYRQGENHHCECQTNVPNELVIKWSFNGHRMTDNIDGANMDLRNIGAEHEGVFQCLGDDGSDKPLYSMVTVNVQYAPHVSTRRHHVNTEPKTSAKLYCDYKTNPTAEAYWLKNDIELSNSNKYQIDNFMHKNRNRTELTVNYVTSEDLGEYICKVQNFVGANEARVFLIYEPEKPQFESMEMNGTRVVLHWLVKSIQPLSEAVLDYKISGSYTWSTVSLMHTKRHGTVDSGIWKITHEIDLIPGNWHARVKTKNTVGWSDFSEEHNFVIEDKGETNDAVINISAKHSIILTAILCLILQYTQVPL